MEHTKLNEILERLKALEAELEEELENILEEKQRFFRYQLKKGRVQFEKKHRVATQAQSHWDMALP